MTSPFLSGIDGNAALSGGTRMNTPAIGSLYTSTSCAVCGTPGATCHREEHPDLEGVGMPPRRRTDLTTTDTEIATPVDELETTMAEDDLDLEVTTETPVEVVAVVEVPVPVPVIVEEPVEERPPGAPATGRVVWEGDSAKLIPVRKIAEGLDIVEVREDVWKAAYLPNTRNRIGYTLLVAAGETIQLSSLDTVIK